VDDVVVYYAPPGINDGGARVDVDFTQLKFHVAQTGMVDHDVVIDPDWTGTKKSLLKRFCEAWLEIRASHRQRSPQSGDQTGPGVPQAPFDRTSETEDTWTTHSSRRARIRNRKIRAMWQAVCESETMTSTRS